MRRLAAILLLLVCASAGRSAGADPAVELTADEKALFAWWDSLGYPDVTKLPFVAATNGDWDVWQYRAAPHPAAPEHVEFGFLVGEEGPRFVLFTIGLRLERLARSAAGPGRRPPTGFRRVDFDVTVSEAVDRMQKLKGHITWTNADQALDPFLVHQFMSPKQAFRLVVLARSAAGRGRNDLAHALLELAEGESRRSRGDPPEPAGAEPFADLKSSLADEAFFTARERLAAGDLTLAEAADGFRRFAAALPGHAKAAEARESVEILERMIREAGARPAARAAGIEDEIFALRDLRGLRHMEREIRQWVKTADDSVLATLAARGEEAIPSLLAVVDDRTFSRSLLQYASGRWQIRPSRRPYRVGDAAIDLLDRISQRAFVDGVWDLHPFESAERSALVDRIREWARAREEGEPALLAFAVSQGGARAQDAAKHLLGLPPERSVPALARGVRVTPNPVHAASLTETLGRVPGDASTAALLDLLARDTRQIVRLTAAKALFARGRTEGVDAFASEWRVPRAPIAPKPGEIVWPELRLDGGIVAFLATSGDAAAYRALAFGLDAAPAARRGRVVWGMLEDRAPAPLSPEARDAVEELLGPRLSDLARLPGESRGMDGDEGYERIADLASQALSKWIPDVYRFDSSADPEPQRAAAEALFRARRRGK